MSIILSCIIRGKSVISESNGESNNGGRCQA